MSDSMPHGDANTQFATRDTVPVKFSGIVVTFNDDRHLEECLSALSFCDELIVVDLGSEDKTKQIAARLGARIVDHEWTPLPPREFAVAQANYEWIVFVDPDMVFPIHLVPSIRAKIQQDPSLGVISIPYRNYFLGKPVKYGRWGGSGAFPAVFRKAAFGWQPVVHREFRFRPSFNRITLRGTEADAIKHYWADSLGHLYQKVRRYIPLEGPARYADGERFSYWRLLFEVPYAVFSSLFLQLGVLDGWRGVYLSVFYGWLTWKYLLSLRDHQRYLEKEGLARPGRPSRIWRGVYKLARKMQLPLPWKLPWGGLWLLTNDVMSKHIFYGDPFEQGEQSFLLQFLEPGMTVLDIGAHQGLYTLLASRKVGLHGCVISFEPSPRELRRLRWNLWLNRCRNVRVEPFALGSNEGTVELYVCLGQETGCNSLRPPAVSEPVKKVQVPMTTLDRYMQRTGIHRVDFVKLDVEGAELEVLKGASQLLDSARPIILCELADVRTKPWGYRSVEIYDFLRSRGYRWFSITPDGKLQPCPRKEHFHENLIAVPEEKLGLVATLVGEPGKRCIDSP